MNEGIEMKFQVADIVRFKPEEEEFGLYEVTGYSANGEITLTYNECNSEFYADENALILVCSSKDRKDIELFATTRTQKGVNKG